MLMACAVCGLRNRGHADRRLEVVRDQFRGPPDSRLPRVAAVHRFACQRQHIRPEPDPGHWLVIPVGSSLEPEAFIEAVGRLHRGDRGDRDAAPTRSLSPGGAGANERLSYAASPGPRRNAEHPKPGLTVAFEFRVGISSVRDAVSYTHLRAHETRHDL